MRRCLLILAIVLAGLLVARAQEATPAQKNMEAAFDALAEGNIEQYAGYVAGASEALEQAPGTLGKETSLSVLRNGADALIHMAEKERGNAKAFLQTLHACRLLFVKLIERDPDEARWHYYYGVSFAVFGDTSSLDDAIPEFETALRCSDARPYAAASKSMLGWCRREKKRQADALKRQMQAINAYLQTRGPSFSSGTGWVVCVHCGHFNWNGNFFCLNCGRKM
jgi:tetratricopeptide (TPR) repeat protein